MANALHRAIAEPYAVLRESFAAAAAAAPAGATPTAVAGPWLRATKAGFVELLSSEAALAAVPLLTGDALRRGALPPNSLVRVVGQVQDTFEPEMYPAVVQLAGAPAFGAFHDTMPADAVLPPGAELHRALMSRCVGVGCGVWGWCGASRGEGRMGACGTQQPLLCRCRASSSPLRACAASP